MKVLYKSTSLTFYLFVGVYLRFLHTTMTMMTIISTATHTATIAPAISPTSLSVAGDGTASTPTERIIALHVLYDDTVLKTFLCRCQLIVENCNWLLIYALETLTYSYFPDAAVRLWNSRSQHVTWSSSLYRSAQMSLCNSPGHCFISMTLQYVQWPRRYDCHFRIINHLCYSLIYLS